ncbi:alcohol dehydrogenase catalytic domain-containing protein [Acrocarpospora sp. B8E8]|uniref:alcohol dehydrogenase catalytic domain-containing protein n=1 Tax=Acrocarpospora sp. B8E8 TaxID=3153572 RepID=UPI00325F39D6
MGHEFVGVVEDVGAQVATLRRGDFVIAPFAWSDGTCEHVIKFTDTAAEIYTRTGHPGALAASLHAAALIGP